MEIIIRNEKDNATEKISFSGSTVEELLHHLKINPETVLVVRNSEVIIENEALNDKDDIEILSVISGG